MVWKLDVDYGRRESQTKQNLSYLKEEEQGEEEIFYNYIIITRE